MPELIMIHGGNKQTPDFCRRAAWSYGVQFGYAAYAVPAMFDYTGDGSDWLDYLDTLARYQPRLALAADFREINEYQTVANRSLDIALLGIIPVVVAKFQQSLLLIPEKAGALPVRVGVSVPTSHMNDGYIPSADELRVMSHNRRQLHLLGGHPDQWLYLMQQYSSVADVESIDGNVLYRQARDYGKMWSRHGYYHELRGQGHSTNAMTVCSMRNAERYLASGWRINYQSPRIVACQQQTAEVATQQELFNL